MTGYFSQLARHTGLSFEPGATMTTSSVATEPTVADQRPGSAPPAPPHVEEIIFTAAPAFDAVEGISDGRAVVSAVDANALLDRDSAAAGTTDDWNPNQTESKDDDHPRGAAATAKRMIDVSPDTSREESRIIFTDSDSRTRNTREHSAEEQPPANEPRVVQPAQRSGAERQLAPQESIELTHESIEMVESQFAAQGSQAQGRHAPRPEAKDSEQPQPARVREPADAVRNEHLEREMIVHSYLKEVRAWVAAPPDYDQREMERQRDREVFALEPEVEPTAPRPGRPETLEVQDLNLSIGTISIVIEESKHTAPAVLPAPPGVDRSFERPASEPTRLSRYYLRRW